jgi:hypothetical protein
MNPKPAPEDKLAHCKDELINIGWHLDVLADALGNENSEFGANYPAQSVTDSIQSRVSKLIDRLDSAKTQLSQATQPLGTPDRKINPTA